MPQKKVWILLLALLALSVGGIISAQDATATNLLRDPGFENQSTWPVAAAASDNSAVFAVAPDWQGWVTEQPRTQDWQNRIPNGYPFSENGAGYTHSGNRSQEISRGSATFTAAVYQSVAVTPNSNVTGSAWVRMNLNLNANPGAQARVGIDPNGGSNPFDSDIVWSTWAVNSLYWTQLTVSATVVGPNATIFLYATQAFPADPNGMYWDDASLTGGGAGGAVTPGTGTAGTPGATAAPTVPPPPAQASFVVPQPPQADGSVVHTVQSGDTINAISVAYGVAVPDILTLNNLANARIIQIGQRLIIRPAGEGGEEEGGEDNGTAAPIRTRSSANTSEATASGQTAGQNPTAEPQEEEPTAEEPAPQPTRTPAPPAPVAQADTDQQIDPASVVSSVCVTLFEDTNMNRIQDQEEIPLSGGEITLNKGAETVETHEPSGEPDPFCFSDLEAGDYVAAASAPENYGLTSPDQIRLRVQPGTTLNVVFGAAEGVEAAAPPPADAGQLVEEVATPAETETDSTNQLLQISGLIVFGLAGVTLIGGAAAVFLMRRR